MRTTIVGLLTAGLLAACAGTASAEPPPGLNGMTWRGTVVDKGYNPAHMERVCKRFMGCIEIDRPECWRLDLRTHLGRAWDCAKYETWRRAKPGDHWNGTTVE